MGALGCGSVTVIAPYDQKIDDGVTNLQKSTAEFFTKIERQGGSDVKTTRTTQSSTTMPKLHYQAFLYAPTLLLTTTSLRHSYWF